MKIKKHFLTILFSIAIVLSVSAQNQQYEQSGAPIFYNNAQYRDYRRSLLINETKNFKGDRLYLGTNALQTLGLMPNITLEWRRNEKYGLSLNVGGMYVGVLGGVLINVQSKHYLGEKKSWYAGPAVNFAYFKYLNYRDLYDDIGEGGYDRVRRGDILATIGGTFGYMQRIRGNFAIDYNIGLGVYGAWYNDRRSYNSSSRGGEYGLALTQLGITLLWQVCSK